MSALPHTLCAARPTPPPRGGAAAPPAQRRRARPRWRAGTPSPRTSSRACWRAGRCRRTAGTTTRCPRAPPRDSLEIPSRSLEIPRDPSRCPRVVLEMPAAARSAAVWRCRDPVLIAREADQCCGSAPPLTSLRPLPRLAPPQKVIVDGIAFSAAAPASILAFFVTPWNSHGPAGQARSSLLTPPRHTCHPRSSPPLLPHLTSHVSCPVPPVLEGRRPVRRRGAARALLRPAEVRLALLRGGAARHRLELLALSGICKSILETEICARREACASLRRPAVCAACSRLNPDVLVFTGGTCGMDACMWAQWQSNMTWTYVA